MRNESFLKRLEGMPVPLLPTMVGAITLANFMQGLGYEWVRHVTLWIAMIIWICYVVKMVIYPKTCLGEYGKTIPRSLYAGFSMMMMGIGGYLFAYIPVLGKGLWLAGICIHACHILYFTVKAVGKNFSWDTCMPSWFVTYNGIMVSTVVGGAMGMPGLGKIIVYYGIAIYIILIPIMIYRLIKKPVNPAFYHTQAIVLAPCSLCLVSYINFIENKSLPLMIFLYICVILSTLFIIVKLPKFFSFPFNPGYAGMTFPMAIGTVATGKMAAALGAMGYENIKGILTQIAGFQCYLTTMIVGYVLLRFLMMFLKVSHES